MKNAFTIIFVLSVLAFTGCTGNDTLSNESKGKGHVSQPSNTLYTMEAAMEAYALQPERALQIIDSAKIVGNLSDFGADLLRAKVYAWTCEKMNYDSAILIGERLMCHDSMMTKPDLQEDVLEILMNACRLRKDNEQALHWASQLCELYSNRGEETEALRTSAEIGALLIRIGQQTEGLAKIDSVIHQLDGKRKFNELDASIIALRRKTEICIEKKFYEDAILTTQHMLSLLDDYEQHPTDFHDGDIREPLDANRPEYIDFYRGKAYAYLATVYSSLASKVEGLELADTQAKAREYLALYDQTVASQNITGRFMISPTLRRLGEYDRVLAIYDEVEQQLDTDTLNANYVEILRGRSEVAFMRGHLDDAKRYWKRYTELNDLLTESLLQGKAHLYAARFHAHEQQREIERQREATHRIVMSRTIISLIGLLILLIAIYAVRQWYKTHRHNHILAQQITEAVEYKEKYKELKRSIGALAIRQENADSPQTPDPQLSSFDSQLSTPNLQLLTANSSDSNLFTYLRDLIEREQMFLNPNFERQTLINLTGLSKERIGAAFAQGSGHERLTSLVRELRLDYAVRLMNEKPELSIEQVCQSSGFANADTFTRNFKAKFGMTPTAYRETKA